MINIELLKLLMEIKHKINITMRYLNKLKEIINDWFRDKTMEQYEKILVRTDFGGSYYRYILICKKCGKIKKLKSNN